MQDDGDDDEGSDGRSTGDNDDSSDKGKESKDVATGYVMCCKQTNNGGDTP